MSVPDEFSSPANAVRCLLRRIYNEAPYWLPRPDGNDLPKGQVWTPELMVRSWC